MKVIPSTLNNMYFIRIIASFCFKMYLVKAKESSLTHLTFMQQPYPSVYWKDIQTNIDLISKAGSWKKIDKYADMQCFEEPSKACMQSKSAKGLNYSWIVSETSYHNEPFSIEHICKIMNGQSMLLVGDSITTQFGTVLLNYLYKVDQNEYCNEDLSLFTTGMHEIKCSHHNIPNFRLIIVRNDLLSLISYRKSHRSNITNKQGLVVSRDSTEEDVWIHYLNISQPGIVVLNRGAHYANTSSLLFDVTRTIEYVKTYFPSTTLIWRNTPRGIENYRRTFLDQPSEAPLDPNRSSQYPYAYEQFHLQNQAILELLNQRFPSRVYYWDVAYPMSFREDGHRDPLHYCIPGPMDSWPHMMLNILNFIYVASRKHCQVKFSS